MSTRIELNLSDLSLEQLVKLYLLLVDAGFNVDASRVEEYAVATHGGEVWADEF